MRNLGVRGLVRRLVSVPWLGIGLIACGGGGDSPGTTEPPAPKPVATVTVTLASSTVIVGRTVQGSVALADAGGATLTGRAVQWSTTSTAIATVDQAGLVTGVAPGTATITATSEGKSGTASLTVTTDPATTATIAFGAITSNGQPVDTSKVAGTITVNVDQAVPANFVGTYTLTLRDVEISRQALPDAAPDRGTLGSYAIVSTGARARTELVDVSSATTSLTAEALTVTPRFRNGLADLKATLAGVVGTTPVQASATRRLNLASPSGSVVMIMQPKGARATDAAGNTWDAGAIDVYAGVLNFDVTPAQLERVDVLLGPPPTTYGFTNGAAASVLRKTIDFAPNVSPKFTLGRDELNVESGAAGYRLWLDSYRVNGATYDPQVLVPSLNGITFDTNGDGLVDQAPAPQGAALPAGVSRGLWLPTATFTLPTGRYLYGTDVFRLDNKGPGLAPDSYRFTDRKIDLYVSPFSANNTIGSVGSYVTPNVNLEAFTDYSRVSDGGVGYTTSDTRWYVGPSPDLASLLAPANRWSPAVPLVTTSGRTLYSAMEASDKLGNATATVLRASTLNNYTTGNVAGTPGASPALFGVGPSMPGTGAVSGLIDRATISTQAFNTSLKYTFRGTGGAGTFGDYGLTGRVYKGSDCVIGASPLPGQCLRVNVPATSGGAGSMSWSVADILAKLPGSDKQGLYALSMVGYDNAGVAYGGDSEREFKLLVDHTPPVFGSGTGVTMPFTAGQTLEFQGSATDNVSVADLIMRVNFQGFPSSLFRGGYVHAPFATSTFRNPFTDALAPSRTETINAAVPHAIRLFSSAGTPATPVYRATSVSWAAKDGSWNLSDNVPPISIPSSALPVLDPNPLPADLNYTIDAVPQQSVCSERVEPCDPGTQRTTVFGIKARTALAVNPFLFVQFYAIAVGGDVFPLCRANTFTATLVAALWLYAYQCTMNWDYYKGPPGNVTAFAWGVTAQYVIAKSQFQALTVLAR